MQQLQNASDPLTCARGVLETVLEILVTVREQCARRQGGGPSLMHFRALAIIRKRPSATLSTLSDQLALTISATSRLVNSLVEKGLVERRIPPGNRRTVSLLLTGAGNRTLDTAMRETHRELALPLHRLTPAQRQSLTRSLELLRQVVSTESSVRPRKVRTARRSKR